MLEKQSFLNVSNTAAQFPDPFCDMASTAMPKDIKEAMRWCQFIVSVNGTYRAAIQRIISYFITDIELVASSNQDGKDTIGDEEKAKYLEFLNDVLGIKVQLSNIAMDYLVYGNSFASLLMPFRRFLSCPNPKCRREAPLNVFYEDARYKFKWDDYKFKATCPRCKYSGPFKRMDRRSNEPEKVRIKRWSPLDIDLLHDQYSDNCEHIWKIPGTYKTDIQRGELFHLSNVPWEIVEAVKKDKAFKFSNDAIYHMREDALAGVVNRGYGISRVLANFKQAWYCQVLHRYNEAIALDYIIPFRVLSPAARSGASPESSDPLLSMHMGDFMGHFRRMMEDRRKDPASMHAFPHPVTYQMLGGEATQLAPHELINQGLKTLLDSIGVPMELYSGTLTAQSAPSSLRLFEANWSHLVHQLNRFLHYVVERVAKIMNWEPVTCRLTRVTHADDLNRQMAKLQLMQGGQISKSTGLASVGISHFEEEQKKVDEDLQAAKLQESTQERLQQQEMMSQMLMSPGSGMPAGPAAPAAPVPPGAPMPAGGPPAGPVPASQTFAAGQPLIPNAPTTVEELNSVASTLSQQAMTMPSKSQRTSFMLQLRKENPTIHALVKSQISDMERQAALQGRDMILQQQFGQQQ